MILLCLHDVLMSPCFPINVSVFLPYVHVGAQAQSSFVDMGKIKDATVCCNSLTCTNQFLGRCERNVHQTVK